MPLQEPTSTKDLIDHHNPIKYTQSKDQLHQYTAMPVDKNFHFFDSNWNNELTFSKQIDEFSKDHTVILPTLRGYPPSDVPLDEDAYDGNTMAGDLLALLDHLGIEKAVFAAGDVGEMVAQKLAFLHPERVRGLVIFDTPILGTMMHLIHHDPEQQAPSRYSLDYISSTLPGTHTTLIMWSGQFQTQSAVLRLTYLQQSPEGGIFYFHKNFPGPLMVRTLIPIG
ncbi:Hypothetical protein PENO1_027120 [Penicillium occitanis (nom. inval.)]|nr:Hypothetical protein PENO1_027120 [Penicillium occitanis (nom. inval.)]PCH05332.1 hypothetical protein PENOC_028990 [Penicillium occitanis (nom. inval.)]